jgi:DNA-binding CsgD family transcriptional regulator
MMRRIGDPPFRKADHQLVDLALRSIPWLEATLDYSLPVEPCVALTSRQRIVLMMQLDGLSRKEIANQLQISTDTVGDHVKRVYEQFGISSIGELAALFLRNR